MEKLLNQIKFNEQGLVPVVTQDVNSKQVLMLAWMNDEAFKKTIETGKVHYFSRSRNKLWLKGETSGHFQLLKDIRIDCDGDSLLAEVEQLDAACHTGNYSCFFKKYEIDNFVENLQFYNAESKILKQVYDVIVDRTINPKEGSYTNYLFQKGIDKMLKKVGEEASEVIIAAKNRSKDELKYEISDLIYHLLVVMVEQDITMDDIYAELEKRR
jgi:phosphoribosyl-ATP pyrophosphohydrolase/phosphoribosyl-AMP cyclohydrolase